MGISTGSMESSNDSGSSKNKFVSSPKNRDGVSSQGSNLESVESRLDIHVCLDDGVDSKDIAETFVLVRLPVLSRDGHSE